MAYYTEYELVISEDINLSLDELKFLSENLTGILRWNFLECTWHDHEEDLRVFSKNHPNVLFELYGNGEDSEDIWVKYFKNGKMQLGKATITYEEFDESKLK